MNLLVDLQAGELYSSATIILEKVVNSGGMLLGNAMYSYAGANQSIADLTCAVWHFWRILLAHDIALRGVDGG